ncbi:hypothetical protein E4U44_005453 [Claviceps purpurea]|nr:hypothetical protein E4U44_005453 [Claviceps purpurea]
MAYQLMRRSGKVSRYADIWVFIQLVAYTTRKTTVYNGKTIGPQLCTESLATHK